MIAYHTFEGDYMSRTFAKDIYTMLCKKYPNSNIFTISDHHFFHNNIIKYTRNQFHSIEEMHAYIINKHNEVISKDDVVLFLGDFSFKSSEIKEILEQLNGHKYLVLGNHDTESILRNYFSIGLEGVFTTPIQINNNYFSHEPLIEGERSDIHFKMILKEFKKLTQSVNYHGHIHGIDDISSSYKNVSCESLDYKPLYIGRTQPIQCNDKELFINTDYFGYTIQQLHEKTHIDESILMIDYIYSYILEVCNPYTKNYFVQGSFGLFKKYNFISQFSDLDITFIQNPENSKKKNFDALKSMADDVYIALQKIDCLNLEWWKRFSTLKIFDIFYTDKHSCFTHGCFDSNLIPLDCYKETDFALLSGSSYIERMLYQDSKTLETFQFPRYQAQFLIPEGDYANLLLQYLFQVGDNNKKIKVFKKLKYVYEYACKDLEFEEFSNMLSRFFLRNIAIFLTFNRYEEIKYIQKQIANFETSIETLPLNLQKNFLKMLKDDNSPFLDVYNKIASTPIDTLFGTCGELAKTLKRQ